MGQNSKPYDLKARTFLFSLEIIKLAKKFPYRTIDSVLIKQLIRSATSIGANYEEADESFSKAEKTYKYSISKKEAKETNYWLRLLNESLGDGKEIKAILYALIDESKQLVKILDKLIKNNK